MNCISVAIDGPAGAGKSSISRTVAKQMGFIYIDTGAMYRSVALYAIDKGIDTRAEKNKVIECLDDIKIEIKYTDSGQRILLNGVDVSEEIRQEKVSAGASDVAVIPQVRERLVDMQRKMAKSANVIMDGRDICSYVLPNAQVKIFLTASSEARAMRRYQELLEKGIECDFETIKNDMEARDKNDSSRAVSPLKKADDAVLVDTTELDFEQSVEKIKELIKNAL